MFQVWIGLDPVLAERCIFLFRCSEMTTPRNIQGWTPETQGVSEAKFRLVSLKSDPHSD